MRISDWSSDVCSSDLIDRVKARAMRWLGKLRDARLIEPGVDLGGADHARRRRQQMRVQIGAEIIAADALEREVIEVATQKGIETLASEASLQKRPEPRALEIGRAS